jgi:hypothetical protein
VAGERGHSDSEDDGRRSLRFNNRKKWTFQSVVEQHKKGEINARAQELSNAERGSIQFLGSYRRARTEICEGLTEGEQQRYLALVEKWNARPVPVTVQRE